MGDLGGGAEGQPHPADSRTGRCGPVAGDAASRCHERIAAPGEGRWQAWRIVVRIIELLVCIGLAAVTTAIFVVAVITVVPGLRMAGRQR